MKQERKIIALDIGNVCVSIHPERVIARMNLFPTPEILAVSARLECGLISEREWLDFFHEKTGHRLNDDEMIDAWNLIIGDTLSGMPEAVRGALKQGYSFVHLSDVSRFHLTECRRKCEFFHLAVDGVYSFDVGAQKPSEKMFREFERRHGTPCIYFDDRADNIEAARKFGWNAVQFKSSADFILPE